MQREVFKSRLGFLLVSAGCAIGIGNVWRFPYMIGQNGGCICVLFYLFFLLIMGVPIMTMELAVGRASRKSAVLAYKTLEKKNTKWHIHGWFCMLGCYFLMMYYTSVSGWMLDYFIKFLTGEFKNNMSAQDINLIFNNMLASPKEMIFYMFVTVLFGFLVCSHGIQKGLERVNKFMMVVLFLLMIVLAGHSFFLSGFKSGIKFYFVPDLNKMREIGLKNIISSAMTQAFFSLSLGVAAIEIFGSFMSKDYKLTNEAIKICFLDTFVAIMAGLIIFPACFSFGINVNEGPALIFMTLPNVFVNMKGGRIWGSLFFLFMQFASFSTVIAVFENLISFCCDTFGWSRKKSVVINFLFIFFMSLPCVFGFNVLKNCVWHGKNILAIEDFIVSNLLLPLGSLVYLLFCVNDKYGWEFKNYLKEANTGAGINMPEKLGFYFKFILPVLVIIIFLNGLL